MSWRLSQIVVTFFFPSPSRRPLLDFADSKAFHRKGAFFFAVKGLARSPNSTQTPPPRPSPPSFGRPPTGIFSKPLFDENAFPPLFYKAPPEYFQPPKEGKRDSFALPTENSSDNPFQLDFPCYWNSCSVIIRSKCCPFIPSDTKLLQKTYSRRIMFRNFRGILHSQNLRKDRHFHRITREICIFFFENNYFRAIFRNNLCQRVSYCLFQAFFSFPNCFVQRLLLSVGRMRLFEKKVPQNEVLRRPLYKLLSGPITRNILGFDK